MQTFISKTLSQTRNHAHAVLLAFALVVTTSTFYPSQACADGVLSTDFVFQMSNSILQTSDLDLSKLLNGSISKTLPDMVFQDQAPVNVSGITVNLNYKFATPYQYPKLGTEMNLASTDLSGTLKIAKIAVDYVGERIENGMIVHWSIKGECTDVVVSLPSGSAKMMGALDLLVGDDGLPTLTIPWFDVSWTSGAWKLQSLKCSGADNFDAAVRTKLEAYMKDSKAFASQFKDAINSMATDYEKTARTKLLAQIPLNLGVNGLSATLKPAKIIGLVGDQFQVRGVMDLTFINSAYTKKVTLAETSLLPTQSGYTLSLPKTFLSAFNSMAYASGFYNMQKKGSEIASFQSLRQSNLELSFVWTEVTKIDLSRDFLFNFSPDSIPTLSSVAWDRVASLSGTVDTSMTINTLVQNPSGSAYSNFDQITTPVSAAYTLSFTQETAGPTLNIAFSKFALSLNHFWDPSYPVSNTTFDAKSIGDNLTSSMTSSPTQKLIGSFSLTSALTLKPSAFRKTGNWLLLDFAQ